MALFVVNAPRKQPARRAGEEFHSLGQRYWAAKKRRLLVCREIGDRLEIQRDRFLERAKHLFERGALHRYIKVEANRFPVAVFALGIAVQRSRRQFRTFRSAAASGPQEPSLQIRI